MESRAAHGQVAPNTNGGTLNPVAFINPTTVNASGRVAFNSQVDGSDRNQGVFVADSDGTITAIAIGCGGLGGGGDTTSMCGDASPIGGHFGGFFFGTVFTPDINDAGDVLFFCDVNGGDSRRALFLYQAASGQIVKVAAVGDPSPIGGTFGAVGPGSINNNGKVVFLASQVGETVNSNLFMWDNGVVTKIAALGDPAPEGGTFSGLGVESFGFQDGTSIPVGPVPDINDSDQIAFRAIVSGGTTSRGIVVRTNQVDEWYVKVPDPTPIGGTYFDMQAAAINNAGQIAFFADYHPTPQTTNSGWFAGAPGNWRKVVVFFDPIDGGECLGLAFSRNPMQTIDAAGNVVFWANLDSNNPADRLVLGLTDGNLLIAARHGDPTPIGGTFGSMDAWPAINGNIGTLNVATPGAQNGALSAHMAFNHCPSGTPTPTPPRRVPLLHQPRARRQERLRRQGPDQRRGRVLLREVEGELLVVRNNNMNTHLKIALLMLSFIGTWGLTITIKSGYAGSRLACQLCRTRSQLVHQVGNGSGKIHYHRVTHYRISPL